MSIDTYCLFDRPDPVGEDKLFLKQNGEPLNLKRVQKLLQDVGKKAKLTQRLSPHRLRHSYATLALKYGSNLEYLRQTLGHTTTKVTEVYISCADADISAAHRKFSPIVNLGVRRSQPKAGRSWPKEITTADGRKIIVEKPPTVEDVWMPKSDS